MTDYNALITRLKFLSMDTPRELMCQGCGYERNCGTEGCAILRDAVATMEQLYKDVTGSCYARIYGDVLSDQEPCKSCFDELTGENCNWQWQGVQKEG